MPGSDRFAFRQRARNTATELATPTELELIMVKRIVPENSGVVLSSHRDLFTPQEVLQDCLEKAQAMISTGLENPPAMTISLPQQYSLLDDLIELALQESQRLTAFSSPGVLAPLSVSVSSGQGQSGTANDP